jgi:hypothetical protein
MSSANKRSSNRHRMTQAGKQLNRAGQQHNKGAGLVPLMALGMTIVLLLGLALIVVIGHGQNIAGASGGKPGFNVPAGHGSLNHAKGTCGNAGQATCPATDPGWYPLTSESPPMAAQAIIHSPNFVAMQRSYGYVAADTPALVHAYGAHTGNAYYDDDHWVVSVRAASGLRCGIFDFVYDRAHQRMRFSSFGIITAQDLHARQAFPYVSSTTAMARFQSKTKLQAMAGRQAELMFFPIDPNYPVLTSPAHKWTGGGEGPMDAIWSIPASDRHDYFVGSDLNVYPQANLPLAQGQP